MRLPASLLIVLTVCLCGCKPTLEQQLAGHWIGKAEVSSDNPLMSMMNRNLAPSLDVKSDKTFSLVAGAPLEGTWEAANNTLTLHVQKISGMAVNDVKKETKKRMESMPIPMGVDVDQIDRPITLKLAEDGQKLTTDNLMVGGMPIQVKATFTKNSSG